MFISLFRRRDVFADVVAMMRASGAGFRRGRLRIGERPRNRNGVPYNGLRASSGVFRQLEIKIELMRERHLIENYTFQQYCSPFIPLIMRYIVANNFRAIRLYNNGIRFDHYIAHEGKKQSLANTKST